MNKNLTWNRVETSLELNAMLDALAEEYPNQRQRRRRVVEI